MSKAGCPCDIAKAESFFKTLKKEEVYLNQYQNFAEARANLGAFLEDVYNVKRLHSSLGYLPPTEFEQHFAENLTKIQPLPAKVDPRHWYGKWGSIHFRGRDSRVVS